VAIYHLSAKIVSRQSGRSVVAAAAYRAGQSLEEEATGITHDYTRKEGVEHSEILAPEGAPDWVHDRSKLWNTIEAVEKRKDAQLAREIEIGLPIELDADQQLALLREYAKREFVARGMVADFSIHRDDPNNPHAHILLTMRRVSEKGFGLKERSWNERSKLMDWRQGWEEVTNEHLARAGLAVRIDHRSLKAQGLILEPGRKIGVGLERQKALGLPDRIADRVTEQREIARENGQRILENPHLALKSLTHTQATFSKQDIAKFLHTRTDGAEQFQAALLKVTTSPELVSLGRDDRNVERFTSREMLKLEASLLQRAQDLAQRSGHAVAASRAASVLSQHRLSSEQHHAFGELVAQGDLKALVGVAGSGKSRLLAAAREAWEAEGFTVKGAALSGIAAENLTLASGIQSRTLASFEWAWNHDRDPLTSRDVIVIDETGMVGTRQLARFLDVAESAGAKVVLVGDPEQLQAIEAGAPFRGIVAQSGMAELNEVQRQRHPWQREATRELASGSTANALTRYEGEGAVIQVPTREAARTALLARWAKEGKEHPDQSRLMMAYTREDVRELNELARTLRQQQGELGHAEKIATGRGVKEFAVGDRLYFLRNEKSLGVKNGSLGTIEVIRDKIVQVRLDGRDRERVAVDTRFYTDLDYGYAATVYKAQGSTVDRTYLLATPHYDRHATYVALSRHRESATVFYGAQDFGAIPENLGQRAEIRARFLTALSRARPKELAHDYLDRDVTGIQAGRGAVGTPARVGPTRNLSIDEVQRQGREAWLAQQADRRAREQAGELQPDQNRTPMPERDARPLSVDELRAQGREAWRRLREQGPPAPDPESTRGQELERDRDRGLEKEGPELDL
jgi:Ti-type conjugative transfer relaxase TraA